MSPGIYINRKMLNLWKLLIIFAGSVFLFSSCVPNRKLVYVQPEKEKKTEYEAFINKPKLIQPGDNLYITIDTEDQESNFFTNDRSGGVMLNDISLISYLVNQSGYVRFPVIGNIKLAGLTLDEAAITIEKALTGILSTPTVTVKFVNKNVTILGEVNNPGRYQYSDEYINIFQALGYAGDITEYGNRKKVLIIRESGNNIVKEYVDLTKDSLLDSYQFYVIPGDVIYVAPLKRKKWGIQNFPFNLVVSTISTTLLILSYINLNRL